VSPAGGLVCLGVPFLKDRQAAGWPASTRVATGASSPGQDVGQKPKKGVRCEVLKPLLVLH